MNFKNILIFTFCLGFLSCTEYPSDEVAIKLFVEHLQDMHTFGDQWALGTKNPVSKDYPINFDKVLVIDKYKSIVFLSEVIFKFRIIGSAHTFWYDNGNYATGKKVDKGIEKFDTVLTQSFKKEGGKWRVTNFYDYFEFKK